MISGCSVISEVDRSDLVSHMPDSFITNTNSRADVSLTWADSFNNPDLEKDITTLLSQNFELEAGRARIRQAAAYLGIRNADLFPSVFLTADIHHEKNRKEGEISRTNKDFSLETSLNWDLDIWGRLKAKKEAAVLTFKENMELYEQTVSDLEILLVESWIDYHTASQLERVLQQQQIINTQFLKLTELRFKQGQGNSLDVLQQRGHIKALNRQLLSIKKDMISSDNSYAVLLGRIPDGITIKDSVLPKLEPFKLLPTPKSLLNNRRDLKAAFLSVLAADQEVAAAIANRLPQLSIGFSYNVNGDTISNMTNNKIISIVTGVLAPIFDAGKRKAEVSNRQEIANEALAKLRHLMLTVMRDIETGLYYETTFFEEQELINKEIVIAERSVAEARIRYINGQDNYLRVLEALGNLQTLYQHQILLNRDLLKNRARLLKFFGAKWRQNNEAT